MRLALLLLVLFLPLSPTVDRFVVSSASCDEAYLQWDERSVELNVYTDVYFEFVTWDERRVYTGEYLGFTYPEWWWTPFDGDGETWAVSGFAMTEVGQVETFNHLEITCVSKAYAPFVGGG